MDRSNSISLEPWSCLLCIREEQTYQQKWEKADWWGWDRSPCWMWTRIAVYRGQMLKLEWSSSITSRKSAKLPTACRFLSNEYTRPERYSEKAVETCHSLEEYSRHHLHSNQQWVSSCPPVLHQRGKSERFSGIPQSLLTQMPISWWLQHHCIQCRWDSSLIRCRLG